MGVCLIYIDVPPTIKPYGGWNFVENLAKTCKFVYGYNKTMVE